MTAARPESPTTPSPSVRLSPSTLRRIAVREALMWGGPRVPGDPGPRNQVWVEHRYAELLKRYGVVDDQAPEER